MHKVFIEIMCWQLGKLNLNLNWPGVLRINPELIETLVCVILSVWGLGCINLKSRAWVALKLFALSVAKSCWINFFEICTKSIY